MSDETQADVLADFLERWPMSGYELEAYCAATLIPALRASPGTRPPERAAHDGAWWLEDAARKAETWAEARTVRGARTLANTLREFAKALRGQAASLREQGLAAVARLSPGSGGRTAQDNEDRSDETMRRARAILASWVQFCRGRGGAHAHKRTNGVRYVYVCTGCAYDAVAEALERAPGDRYEEGYRAEAVKQVITDAQAMMDEAGAHAGVVEVPSRLASALVRSLRALSGDATGAPREATGERGGALAAISRALVQHSVPEGARLSILNAAGVALVAEHGRWWENVICPKCRLRIADGMKHAEDCPETEPRSDATEEAMREACPVPNCHAGMLRGRDGRDSVSCPVCDGVLTPEAYHSLVALHAPASPRSDPGAGEGGKTP